MEQAQTTYKQKFSVQPYNLTAALKTQPPQADQSNLEKFKAAITDLFIRGRDLRNDERGIQDKATVALSKILGIAQDIYGKASILEKEELMDHLRQRCRSDGLKKIDKRTTIFHLLSRQFRGSDRKQASSDAKILDRADKEGQSEKTFCDWVKNLGGLNNIKNSSALKNQKSDNPKKTSETESKPKHKHERKFVVAFHDEAIPGMFKHLTKEKIYPARLFRFPDGSVKIAVYDEVEKSDGSELIEGEFDTQSETEEQPSEEIA